MKGAAEVFASSRPLVAENQLRPPFVVFRMFRFCHEPYHVVDGLDASIAPYEPSPVISRLQAVLPSNRCVPLSWAPAIARVPSVGSRAAPG